MSARRRGGLTLVELMLAVPLLSSLLLLLGHTAHLAWRASDRARRVAVQLDREARLEADLARRVRAGVALECLSIAPDGRLVEGAVEGALQRWSLPEALAIRTATGYALLARSGDRLVRHELDERGRATSELVAARLQSARFALERDAAGEVVGASWEVTTADGSSSGYAGQRVDRRSAPRAPAAPAAPRWPVPAGGGR